MIAYPIRCEKNGISEEDGYNLFDANGCYIGLIEIEPDAEEIVKALNQAAQQAR